MKERRNLDRKIAALFESILARHHSKKPTVAGNKDSDAVKQTNFETIFEISYVESPSFKCDKCDEKFQHRRGFLAHIKKVECNEIASRSLDATLNAIYQDVLRRAS